MQSAASATTGEAQVANTHSQARIASIASQIKAIETQIAQQEAEISSVQHQIDAAMSQAEEASKQYEAALRTNNTYFSELWKTRWADYREVKEHLRRENEQLLRKEKQLRQEKEQLVRKQIQLETETTQLSAQLFVSRKYATVVTGFLLFKNQILLRLCQWWSCLLISVHCGTVLIP